MLTNNELFEDEMVAERLKYMEYLQDVYEEDNHYGWDFQPWAEQKIYNAGWRDGFLCTLNPDIVPRDLLPHYIMGASSGISRMCQNAISDLALADVPVLADAPSWWIR